jgi:hypothetical protein
MTALLDNKARCLSMLLQRASVGPSPPLFASRSLHTHPFSMCLLAPLHLPPQVLDPDPRYDHRCHDSTVGHLSSILCVTHMLSVSPPFQLAPQVLDLKP